MKGRNNFSFLPLLLLSLLFLVGLSESISKMNEFHKQGKHVRTNFQLQVNNKMDYYDKIIAEGVELRIKMTMESQIRTSLSNIKNGLDKLIETHNKADIKIIPREETLEIFGGLLTLGGVVQRYPNAIPILKNETIQFSLRSASYFAKETGFFSPDQLLFVNLVPIVDNDVEIDNTEEILYGKEAIDYYAPIVRGDYIAEGGSGYTPPQVVCDGDVGSIPIDWNMHKFGTADISDVSDDTDDADDADDHSNDDSNSP